jgi:CRISPR-associated protein Csd1
MLAALKGCYDRLAEDQDSGIAPYGYSPEKISFALMLDRDGRLLEVVDLRDTAGKKPAPRVLQVPQSFKRPGITPRSFFLWDKVSFVLGVGAKPKDRSEEHHAHRLVEEHAAFKTFHEQVLAGTGDEGLCALLMFLGRWVPAQIDTLDQKDDLLQNPNLVFRLDGERRYLHERPAARAIWAAHLTASQGNDEFCLVSGERGPLARLHPPIKGLRGGQTTGGSIVSFNDPAYESYGKEQGQNAPVSEQAAFAYTTALNHLLRPNSRNRVQIADASTVFWAERHAPAEEALVWSLIEPPAESEGDADQRDARFDPGEAAKIRGVLNQIAKGRPLKEADPDLNDGTRFFVLGLAPNAARIAVRFWHQDTLGNLTRRFGQHYQDLEIEPSRWRTPAIWRLLYETAVQRKAENIPAHLAGEVMRAILTGNRYPRALLAAVVTRIRADGTINGLRAAICKACIIRDLRAGGTKPEEDYLVSLDEDNKTPSYRLGQLFAVYEQIQLDAQGRKLNATIRDQYYGAASATPRAVFPVLQRKAMHHMGALRKSQKVWKRKNGEKYDSEIQRIMHGISPESLFVPHLSLQDQAVFTIGYYHQISKLTGRIESPAPDEDETEEN